MLIQKLTQEELTFIENWYNPICQAECLFSNFDDMGEFDKTKLGEIRLYQKSFLSHESLIDFDGTAKLHGMKEKQKFNLRKNVGDIYNLGARKYGKTLITLRLDIALSILYDDRLLGALFSIDEKRIRGVLTHVEMACDFHPIFRMWKVRCKYKPEIKFYSRKNHWVLNGVNMTLKGKTPGDQWYQIHAQKIWGEEVSFETKKIYDKRKEAVSELGAVIRLAGMTNFTTISPIGKVFNDLENRLKRINLPQYVSPYWDDKEKKDRLKDYGGARSLNYRVFVEGEVIQDGETEFDMELVQKCYNTKEEIKKFEITKKLFPRFKDLIVVDRPKNAERIFIDADVGDKVTEIIILAEVGDKYNYLYNISLYNLTQDQQEKVLYWLIEEMNSNVVGLDCGDALGRNMANHLEAKYSKENIVRYAGSSKIEVGVETDKNDRVVLDKNNKPIYLKEYMSEWAVRRLKVLLYEKRCRLPMDYQFNDQFTAVIRVTTGTRVKFKSVGENHLFDAFRVFAITQWVKKDFNKTKPMKKEWGSGATSTDPKKIESDVKGD